jgi:hypothetical protein
LLFKYLYSYLIYNFFSDEKEKLLCGPFLKLTSDAGKSDVGQLYTIDLSTIEANITKDHYDSVSLFDGDMNTVFSAVMREHGRQSTLGSAAALLKKVAICSSSLQ